MSASEWVGIIAAIVGIVSPVFVWVILTGKKITQIETRTENLPAMVQSCENMRDAIADLKTSVAVIEARGCERFRGTESICRGEEGK